MDNIETLSAIYKEMDLLANDVASMGLEYEGKDEALDKLFNDAVERIDDALDGVALVADYLQRQRKENANV